MALFADRVHWYITVDGNQASAEYYSLEEAQSGLRSMIEYQRGVYESTYKQMEMHYDGKDRQERLAR